MMKRVLFIFSLFVFSVSIEAHTWKNSQPFRLDMKVGVVNKEVKRVFSHTDSIMLDTSLAIEALAIKPSFVPTWVPDSIDGADNNCLKGKLFLEAPQVIGELETINPNGISTLTINSNTTYTTRQYKRTHIVVASNKTLTVKNILNMFGRPTITIQSGGHLVIDGGVITNAYISMVPGSKLTIKNGGKLVMRTNTSFNAPTGAIVEMTNGEILRSNDF